MWFPSKYSPLDTIHLSHLRFHCWKHPLNSSSLFSSDVVSLLIVITSPKCHPRSTNLHLVVLVDPRFVTCDDPFQEFIAFLQGFPVNITLFPSQLLLRSEQFWYNLGAKRFHFQMFHQNRTTFPNQVLLLSF